MAGDSIQKGMSSITMTDDLGSVLEPSFGHALPYFASIAVFPLLACAASYGGWWLAGPFVFFWLCDHFDTALGTDESNMNPGQANSSRLVWYKLAVWIWVALYPVTFVYVFWQIFVVGHLAIWETVLIVLALGRHGPDDAQRWPRHDASTQDVGTLCWRNPDGIRVICAGSY